MATSKQEQRAEAAANSIINLFKKPKLLPEALKSVLLPKGDKPCHKWTIRNQLTMVAQGTLDARGSKQWRAAGRTIKAGTTAIGIWAPLTFNITDDEGDEKTIIKGWRSIAVHSYENTEGDELPEVKERNAHFDSLP